MRAQVRDSWSGFVSGFEGRVEHMYLDTLKLVTFGVGRKIDDGGRISDYGLTRPWRDKTGALVLEAKIRQEWDVIKSHSELAPKGGHAFKSVASLYLYGPDIDEALMDTTTSFWATLLRSLPALESWPSDAQLALLDMAYHMGPNFLGSSWPTFTAAAKTADFGRCAESCQTAKRTPRDQAHVKLFTNAAAVSYAGLSPDQLWGVGRTPTVGALPGAAAGLTSISSAKVAAAKAAVFLVDAWYVQRMLMLAGTYVLKIDGMFGTKSRAAYATWATRTKQPNTINKTVLGKLSASTLHMPVT